MRTLYKIFLIASVLMLAACEGEKKQTKLDNASAIPVKLKKVALNDNNPFITASGKVKAENTAELSTRIMGYVTKVHVKVGDKVRKGQLLISINNADLRAKKAQIEANIIKAQASFNSAEKDYNRFKNLFDQNSASQKELDDMTVNYNVAKANLEIAKEMKNEVNAEFVYSNIRAPFSGIITNKFIEEGAIANPGRPLISVEDKQNFEIIAMIPETEISKIRKGVKVDVYIKSIAKKLKGIVTEISTSTTNLGGQYLVKISLDKNDTPILSGMFATVHFPVQRVESTSGLILISKEAIVTNGQLKGVYTVSQSNKALLRWLRLGRNYGDQIEVLSGLSGDENYIISSESKLYNGARVSIQ